MALAVTRWRHSPSCEGGMETLAMASGAICAAIIVAWIWMLSYFAELNDALDAQLRGDDPDIKS